MSAHSTPPGDWEVVEKALKEYASFSHAEPLAALARLREEAQINEEGFVTERAYRQAAEEEAARLREREAQSISYGRRTAWQDKCRHLEARAEAAEALVAENDEVHQGWINRTNRAEARVKKLERELIATRIDRMTAQERIVELEEALSDLVAKIDFYLGPLPQPVEDTYAAARRSLAHEEEA